MVGSRIAGARGPDAGRALRERDGDAEHQRMLFPIADRHKWSNDDVGLVSGELSEHVVAIETGWECFLGIRRNGWSDLDAVGDERRNNGEHALFRFCSLEP